MGEIDRDGRVGLGWEKDRLSQCIPNFGTSRDRLSRSFKIFEGSRGKVGIYPILPNFSRFSRLTQLYPIFLPKMPGKLRKTQDRASRHGPNFGTGRVAQPDPDPDLSKSRDGHPDLDLDPILVEILPLSKYLAHTAAE